MITGERGQRTTVITVGEMDRREIANAVKRFCLVERIPRRVVFDRERAYATLK